MLDRRTILLAQLPIPPAGLEPIRGNVPLAAAYLKMYAESRGLGEAFDIQILPTAEANYLGDLALVDAILSREPWMVGFTCYLWNIDRSLWIAERIKQARPEIKIIIGGPEVTSDNAWVLQHPAIDYAAIGEGEQTFTELLTELALHDQPRHAINGLYQAPRSGNCFPIPAPRFPIPVLSPPPVPFRRPLPRLDEISSPYLTNILDAADEQMLLLETIRGCVFKCKFCYYPKSYDDLYFVSEEKIVANLEHARRRGAKEVVLLDPTLNQRRDFARFLRLLADCNPDHQFTYFGELRAEGITPEIARLLRAANFTEVEIGLQSIDPLAMELMDRNNNLRAFERGARAMLDQGIAVKVDLIIGLPGDTPDSVHRGFQYIHDSGLYTQTQVFNLAVLPGTAFRQEAAQLGLSYQERPPYYVLETPTMDIGQIYELMSEAQELFATEFDPLPPPLLTSLAAAGEATGNRRGRGERRDEVEQSRGAVVAECVVDLDGVDEDWSERLPEPAKCTQAFSLWLRSADFHARRRQTAEIGARCLTANPHTTLQIVLEPTGSLDALSDAALEALRAACFQNPSYLDRFYSVLPGRPKGAKRLVVALPADAAESIGDEQRERIEQYACIVPLPALSGASCAAPA